MQRGWWSGGEGSGGVEGRMVKEKMERVGAWLVLFLVLFLFLKLALYVAAVVVNVAIFF